jgi:antitoxin PrlF
MANATVTSKGQVTIPADIRRSMNLVAGQQVVFTQLSDGTTVMRAKTRSVADSLGMLKPNGSKRKVAIKDMNIGRR